jgi:hypothetical protein
MLKNHLWGILNAIIAQTTNAIGGSLNAPIQKVKSRACGYRNQERFKRDILFHLDGLDLIPSNTTYPNHAKAESLMSKTIQPTIKDSRLKCYSCI